MQYIATEIAFRRASPHMSDSPSDPPLGDRPWLRRADQGAIAVVLAICLAAMLVYVGLQRGQRGRMIDIDHVAPRQAEFRLDPNTADWPEWVQVPGVGETLGRRIVAERTQNGPFLDHDDLQRRVSGIGPRTLDGMRPYLRSMPPMEMNADAERAPRDGGG